MCQFVRNRRVFSFGTAFAQGVLPAAENGTAGEGGMGGWMKQDCRQYYKD